MKLLKLYQTKLIKSPFNFQHFESSNAFTGPPQWWPNLQRVAAAAAAFYSAKSREGLGLGGLASRGGPVSEFRLQFTIFFKTFYDLF